MNKFVVIVLDEATKQQGDALTELLRLTGFVWWHWFQDIWLVPAVADSITPKLMYDAIMGVEVLKKANVLVLFFDSPPTYFGQAPPDSWKWFEHTGAKVSN